MAGRQFSLVASIPPVMLLAPSPDAAGRASPFRSLKNALKAYIVCHINQGVATPVALTLQQATAVAGTSAKALAATPVWSNLNTATNDSLPFRGASIGYTTDAGVTDKIVVFEITPESCMDIVNGFDCIGVTTGASSASNITEATLFIVGAIQSASPPNSYVD